MKILNLKILFVIFISLAFCGEAEKYTFIYGNLGVVDIGEKWRYRTTQETSFNIPGIGFVNYSGSYIDETEYLGIDGEFWKFKATLSDIESDNYVNGIEILDQYREAMEDSPCYLYVKITDCDCVDYIEYVNEEDYYLQEAFEAAHININPKRFKYPFGSDAVNFSVGEKWKINYDSVKFYVNMGSPPSLLSTKITWTFKKVKNRGGRKIAIVENKELLTLDLRVAVNFMGEKHLMSGHATGTADATYKWDLDSGEMLQAHGVVNLVGDFEMDNETFHMKIFQRNISKKVK